MGEDVPRPPLFQRGEGMSPATDTTRATLAAWFEAEGFDTWVTYDEDDLDSIVGVVLDALGMDPALVLAERDFLAASVDVWREVDRQSSAPDGYKGIDAGTALRLTERAAWERYRDLLDARNKASSGDGES